MQLQDYARVVLKRGWIIILLAVITAGGAFLFSKLQTPIYKSTVTLSAVPARPSDYGQTLAIKNLLRLYVQQLQSPGITQQVIDKLQLDVSPTKFVSYMDLSADEADLIIKIEARHPLIHLTPKIAQTVADTFVSFHNQENLQIDQRDRVLVNVLVNASSPEQFSPKTSINTLAGGILGALIGVLLIFVIEWFESDIIRSPEDIDRYVGVVVLGAIPLNPEPARARTVSRKQ
ncbi:MAG: hypothetical protein HY327_00555 [Chloroflexi bacterium]|nr:hypothetical protein [Chloroflexota bacterium]